MIGPYRASLTIMRSRKRNKEKERDREKEKSGRLKASYWLDCIIHM
jgi:hypothetical protein